MLHFLRKIISPNNPIRLIWHFLKAFLANLIYGFPAKKLICIGVTGTNGKTTTTHMVEHVLHAAGKKVAMLSTVEFRLNGEVIPNLSKKTTMSPFQTQKFLRQCVKEGVEYVVIESSSHALHQYRLWGIPFQIATLTNITHEHLDYHGTMEEYKNAKKKLFEIVSVSHPQSTHNRPTIVLNVSDQFFEEFNQIPGPEKISYGFNQGALQAKKADYSKFGSTFQLAYKEKNIPIELKVPGEFNIENALATSGVALAIGIPLNEIQKALQSFTGVPGRMEIIKSPKGFQVMVDFALTPDALERLYSTLRASYSGRIIGLIGSCGDRDKEKRPVMGEIVTRLTDVCIVTDEEPYSEDPMVIMKAILEGAKKVRSEGDDLHLIKDRYEAIEFAIKNAQKDDLIVVTGMGNFGTRTMNNGPVKWDDREVARGLIKKYS